MANQWFRLWHDMPNDPKWRTIARASGQPISLVIATYISLLSSASQNVTRGHANVTLEDIASQLDVTESEIKSIFDAMQGRVLDGFIVTGWAKRQPKKEDAGDDETGAKSAVVRKREQREREKLAKENGGKVAGHEKSRKVTTDKDKDKDKDKEIKTSIVELFDFWRVTLCHEKSRLDEKRKKIIEKALALGYSVDDLKTAIVGCSKTPHNMGKNDRGEKYDDISLIFRDAGQIDRFIQNAGFTKPSHVSPSADIPPGYKYFGGQA